MLPQNIERIAFIGANVSINAEKMLPACAERIASICANNGTQLTIRNASNWLPQNLERIAHIAKGFATLEID